MVVNAIQVTLPYGDYNKLINTPTLSFLPLTGGTLTGSLTSRTIAPSADSTYDLGENTARYANLFVDSITCGGAVATGALTSTSGTFSSGLYANGRLYLPNGSVSAPSLAFANDGDTGMYMGASVSLRFAQAGVDRLIIANGGNATFSGKLGVGVTASTPTLYVKAHDNSWSGGMQPLKVLTVLLLSIYIQKTAQPMA